MKPWMIFVFFLVLVMQGCTATKPIPDEALFKTWQGKPKDELVAAFGTLPVKDRQRKARPS
jgi:hypothetical protein